MLAPVVALAAIQFQPTGYVLSCDGSLNGSATAALRVPVVRNSIRHLVLDLEEPRSTEDMSAFLLNFLFIANQFETCTLWSCAKADVLSQWLSAFIQRFSSGQDGDHHVSHLCLLRDCRPDDSGETMQSRFSSGDSELGFYPRRAALEQEVLDKFELDERQVRVNFSPTGQGRISRYQNKDTRMSLCLYTWEVEVEQMDEPNRMEDNNKVEFAVIEIS